MRFLRSGDYANLDRNNPLSKIYPFLSFVEDKCKSVYVPSKDICVDGSLLLFKCRLAFRRYIPPKCEGIKFCLLSLRKFDRIYLKYFDCSRKNENEHFMSNLPEVKNVTFSEKVVVALLSTLTEKGYHLFTDNFFSSVLFAQFLYQQKTLMTNHSSVSWNAADAKTTLHTREITCLLQK